MGAKGPLIRLGGIAPPMEGLVELVLSSFTKGDLSLSRSPVEAASRRRNREVLTNFPWLTKVYQKKPSFVNYFQKNPMIP